MSVRPYCLVVSNAVCHDSAWGGEAREENVEGFGAAPTAARLEILPQLQETLDAAECMAHRC